MIELSIFLRENIFDSVRIMYHFSDVAYFSGTVSARAKILYHKCQQSSR